MGVASREYRLINQVPFAGTVSMWLEILKGHNVKYVARMQYIWGSIQLDIENSIEYSIEISIQFYRVSHGT